MVINHLDMHSSQNIIILFFLVHVATPQDTLLLPFTIPMVILASSYTWQFWAN